MSEHGEIPHTALAQGAGLELQNGIKVNEHLCTSDPDIYAAGDVANAFHPLLGKHICSEHWFNALSQPAVAARSLLGQNTEYSQVPYFFTDQFGLGMEYCGYVAPAGYGDVLFRGDKKTLEFMVFWLKEHRVMAWMNVNIWDQTEHIKALIRSALPVDAAQLANIDVSLETILVNAQASTK